MPLLGLGIELGKQGGITSSPAPSPYDPDALNWFSAVSALGGTVSDANKPAINAFFVALKTGGVWSSIAQANLFAGASTVASAMAPIVGSTIANNGFLDADYSSTLGLTNTNGTRYINTNRANNADASQNSRHMYVFVTSMPTLPVTASQYLMGSGNVGSSDSRIYIPINTSNISMSLSSTSLSTATNPTLGAVNGFGLARNSATTVIPYVNGSLGSSTNNVVTPTTTKIGVFATGTGVSKASARIGFYSIGSFADLAVIDAAVKTLFTQLT